MWFCCIIISLILLIMFNNFVYSFWGRVLLCSLDWPEAYTNQTRLQHVMLLPLLPEYLDCRFRHPQLLFHLWLVEASVSYSFLLFCNTCHRPETISHRAFPVVRDLGLLVCGCFIQYNLLFLLIGFVGSFITKMVSFKSFWDYNSISPFSFLPSKTSYILLPALLHIHGLFHLSLIVNCIHICIYLCTYMYTCVFLNITCPVSIMLIVSMFSGMTICQTSHKKFCESTFLSVVYVRAMTSSPTRHTDMTGS